MLAERNAAGLLTISQPRACLEMDSDADGDVSADLGCEKPGQCQSADAPLHPALRREALAEHPSCFSSTLEESAESVWQPGSMGGR